MDSQPSKSQEEKKKTKKGQQNWLVYKTLHVLQHFYTLPKVYQQHMLKFSLLQTTLRQKGGMTDSQHDIKHAPIS